MITIKKAFILAAIVLFSTSCSTTFYQVYKATPIGPLTSNSNNLVYEDDNCKVSYNLWDEGGDVGFLFYNKTDQEIYVDLTESFFIINGMARNYYRDRVFAETINSGTTTAKSASVTSSVTGYNYLNLIQTNRKQVSSSAAVITSKGYSTEYNEEKIIHIPAKTSKVIAEYGINSTLFRDCDLLRYPTKSQIKSKFFTKADSPIIFSNRISYSVGQSGERIKFENEFYVNEVTNYPEKEMLETKSEEFCGQKSMTKSRYFKDVAPNKFYLRYSKVSDKWRH